MSDELKERVLDAMNTAALTLRGMTMDPAIPEHAKGAIWQMVAVLEVAYSDLLASQ